MLDTIQKTLDTAVQDDPANGVYRVGRDIFTDPEIFELEMKHIFEGNWIYLAHESQIPDKNDYFTTYMGRQPIFIARNRDCELNAFINACGHRGAMLCRFKRGNKVTSTCPFHGWTFNNSGKLLKVKDPDGAGYPDSFNKEGSHDRTKVARFESYRGFLFGSLNPDVPSLAAHLGETTKIIDLMVDQSTEGLEVLRGASTYVYDGNWKLQSENGADGYHVTAVHWNYVATTQRRKQAERPDNVRAMNLSGLDKLEGGFYSFDNDHLMIWGNSANPEDRPHWERREQWAAQFGETRADWMVRRIRNLCLYPNMYLMDQISSQIRQYRPIAVDKTEVTTYCIAPKRESTEARARRIRQYEDFFNASGMATPDDLEEFRGCQTSYRGRAARWNDLSRGAKHWIRGPNAAAESIGLNPLMSGARVEDEGLFLVQHKYWQEAMRRALATETRLNAKDKPMSMMLEKPQAEPARLSVEEVQQFLYREARFLDDKEWESWLELYAPDAEFWMPSWDDDDQLVTDPQTQISLIWYGHKGGLEDRVFRIRTERSSATSMPEPRTSHNISNVEILTQGGGVCELRFNWVTFSYRYKTVDTYFGTSFYTLDTTAAQPLIKRKKVILKNDCIHHVVDIYHL